MMTKQFLLVLVLTVSVLGARVYAATGSLTVTGKTTSGSLIIGGHENPTLYLMRSVNYTWANRAWQTNPIQVKTYDGAGTYASDGVEYSSYFGLGRFSMVLPSQGPGRLAWTDGTNTNRIEVVNFGECFRIRNDVSCDAISDLCSWDAETIRCYAKHAPKVTGVSGCAQSFDGKSAYGCRTGDQITISGYDFGARNKTSGVNVTLTYNGTSNASATCTIMSYDTLANRTVCKLNVVSHGKFNVRVTWRHTTSTQNYVTIDTTPVVPVISRIIGCDQLGPQRVTRCPTNSTVLTLIGTGFANDASYNMFGFVNQGRGSGSPTCTTTGTSTWNKAYCTLNMFPGRVSGEFKLRAAVRNGAWSTDNVYVQAGPRVSHIRGCGQQLTDRYVAFCRNNMHITIMGTGFPPSATDAHVTFNGTEPSTLVPRCTSITSSSYDTIVCLLSMPSPALAGPFGVVVMDSRTGITNYPTGKIYVTGYEVAPNVTSISGCTNSSSQYTTVGCANNTVITMNGRYFATRDNKISFVTNPSLGDGMPVCAVESVAYGRQLTCTLETRGASGKFFVKASTPNSVALAPTTSITIPPVVTGVAGCSQQILGFARTYGCQQGDTLILYGHSFPLTASHAKVAFNTTSASGEPSCIITYITRNSLQCTLTSSASFSGTFRVYVSAFNLWSSNNGIFMSTEHARPTVTAITGCGLDYTTTRTAGCTAKTSGNASTSITITGTGFTTHADNNTVVFEPKNGATGMPTCTPTSVNVILGKLVCKFFIEDAAGEFIVRVSPLGSSKYSTSAIKSLVSLDSVTLVTMPSVHRVDGCPQNFEPKTTYGCGKNTDYQKTHTYVTITGVGFSQHKDYNNVSLELGVVTDMYGHIHDSSAAAVRNMTCTPMHSTAFQIVCALGSDAASARGAFEVRVTSYGFLSRKNSVYMVGDSLPLNVTGISGCNDTYIHTTFSTRSCRNGTVVTIAGTGFFSTYPYTDNTITLTSTLSKKGSGLATGNARCVASNDITKTGYPTFNEMRCLLNLDDSAGSFRVSGHVPGAPTAWGYTSPVTIVTEPIITGIEGCPVTTGETTYARGCIGTELLVTIHGKYFRSMFQRNNTVTFTKGTTTRPTCTPTYSSANMIICALDTESNMARGMWEVHVTVDGVTSTQQNIFIDTSEGGVSISSLGNATEGNVPVLRNVDTKISVIGKDLQSARIWASIQSYGHGCDGTASITGLATPMLLHATTATSGYFQLYASTHTMTSQDYRLCLAILKTTDQAAASDFRVSKYQFNFTLSVVDIASVHNEGNGTLNVLMDSNPTFSIVGTHLNRGDLYVTMQYPSSTCNGTTDVYHPYSMKIVSTSDRAATITIPTHVTMTATETSTPYRLCLALVTKGKHPVASDFVTGIEQFNYKLAVSTIVTIDDATSGIIPVLKGTAPTLAVNGTSLQYGRMYMGFFPFHHRCNGTFNATDLDVTRSVSKKSTLLVPKSGYLSYMSLTTRNTEVVTGALPYRMCLSILGATTSAAPSYTDFTLGTGIAPFNYHLAVVSISTIDGTASGRIPALEGSTHTFTVLGSSLMDAQLYVSLQ
eukprot:PhM_4_TR1283/c0_g1_i1/m.7351